MNVPLYLFVTLLLSIISTHIQASSPFSTPDRDSILYPDDIKHSDTEVALGKVLFFDPRLSINRQQSCATCHNPELGFSDGMRRGIGAMGSLLPRNTPSLYNVAWNAAFLWDGRADSLEEQALNAIQGSGEMAMPLGLLIPRLESVPYYRQAFHQVYGTRNISKNLISKALAAFERSLITDNSPFDQYLAGNTAAMAPAALRGMKLFKGKARCIACHSGPNFTDNDFHNIGVTDDDPGRSTIEDNQQLSGAFKTPGLRNITLTAPYMHDGSAGTLEDVLRFYNRGGDMTDNKSDKIQPLDLNDREIMDLLAFLGALTETTDFERPTIP